MEGVRGNKDTVNIETYLISQSMFKLANDTKSKVKKNYQQSQCRYIQIGLHTYNM